MCVWGGGGGKGIEGRGVTKEFEPKLFTTSGGPYISTESRNVEQSVTFEKGRAPTIVYGLPPGTGSAP